MCAGIHFSIFPRSVHTPEETPKTAAVPSDVPEATPEPAAESIPTETPVPACGSIPTDIEEPCLDILKSISLEQGYFVSMTIQVVE